MTNKSRGIPFGSYFLLGLGGSGLGGAGLGDGTPLTDGCGSIGGAPGGPLGTSVCPPFLRYVFQIITYPMIKIKKLSARRIIRANTGLSKPTCQSLIPLYARNPKVNIPRKR